MKKLSTVLGALAAIVAVSAPAAAADMRAPVRPAPAPMATVFSWTGFYAGINGGWGWARSRWNLQPAGLTEGSHDADGGTVGGQIGYNWQFGSWVFGLEAQGNWADFRGSNVSLVFPAVTNRTQIDAFGLFTGKLGYAWDTFMLYAKGGAAVASVDYRYFTTLTGVTGGTADDTRWGATVGAGLEWAFAPNWSAGVEYNHLFLGRDDVTFAPLPNVTDRVRLDVDVITARLNYRFGGPTVTRY
jgi:outer membrane immunogenic protein